MSMWQVLEIEPTGEVKEIKKAYAKKLKKTNPEDRVAYEKFRW